MERDTQEDVKMLPDCQCGGKPEVWKDERLLPNSMWVIKCEDETCGNQVRGFWRHAVGEAWAVLNGYELNT